MALEICKMLTLSTAHIKPYTAELLMTEFATSEWEGLTVYDKSYITPDSYGWFIYIRDQLPDDEADSSIPADLLACVELALKHGCTVLCLDRDGSTTALLPEYEW